GRRCSSTRSPTPPARKRSWPSRAVQERTTRLRCLGLVRGSWNERGRGDRPAVSWESASMAERRGCSLSRRRETAPSEPRALQQIRRPFKEAGDGWIDQEVFIHKTPSLSAGHRLARRGGGSAGA